MSGPVAIDAIENLSGTPGSDQAADAGAGGGRYRQRLKSVDFSRPTKFTTDHQRRLTRMVDTFCQTAGTRLSAELRCAVELETLNTTQVTWSAAQSSLPAGAASMSVEVDLPSTPHLLLATELAFLLTGIEILLGGLPDRPPPQRRLSEIDWALGRRLLSLLTAQLAVPWQELTGAQLAPGAMDFASEAGRGITMSEPTFVIEIECRIQRRSTVLLLLIPWLAIEGVAERVAGREDEHPERDSPEAEAVTATLATVPVTVRAEVAATEMTVAELLALTRGSVIRLGASAESGVTVYAENTRIGRARPGANGGRRAFQLTDRGEVGCGGD